MSHTRLICVSYMNHLRFVNECFVLCVFQRVHLWKRWGRVGVHDLLYALHLHNHITTPTHRIWVSLRARGERMGVISESLSHTLHLHIHIHICTPTYGLVIHVRRGGIVIWYCLWMHRVTHTSELFIYWSDTSRKCPYPTQKINFCHRSLAPSKSKKKGHNRLFYSFRIDAKIRKVKNS